MRVTSTSVLALIKSFLTPKVRPTHLTLGKGYVRARVRVRVRVSLGFVVRGGGFFVVPF
jgi:hypothetical protein